MIKQMNRLIKMMKRWKNVNKIYQLIICEKHRRFIKLISWVIINNKVSFKLGPSSFSHANPLQYLLEPVIRALDVFISSAIDSISYSLIHLDYHVELKDYLILAVFLTSVVLPWFSYLILHSSLLKACLYLTSSSTFLNLNPFLPNQAIPGYHSEYKYSSFG